MKLISPVISEHGAIPGEFTCEGLDQSPPLQFHDAPNGTKSLALLLEDPDAPSGTYTHWVLFNLPPDQTELEKNQPPTGVLPNGARQGKNDFKKTGYGGPCPPSGTHRYFFKLFALDRTLDLPENVEKKEFLDALKGHVLAEAQLIGTYQKGGPEKSKKIKDDIKVEEAVEESFPASDPPATY